MELNVSWCAQDFCLHNYCISLSFSTSPVSSVCAQGSYADFRLLYLLWIADPPHNVMWAVSWELRWNFLLKELWIYIYLSGAGFWLEVLNCRIGTRNISSLLKTSCLHNSISHFLHHPHLPVLLSRKLHRFQFYGYTTDCRRILKCHDSSLLRIQDGLIMGIYILCGCTGFLPEEWDGFLVTNLYPSFTPTVGVFLAAAVAYGLFKTQGGDPKK